MHKDTNEKSTTQMTSHKENILTFTLVGRSKENI